MNSPSAFDYYITDPTDIAQRQGLINEIEEDLKHLREEAEQYGEVAWAYDADGLWPLDRSLIVLGIQKYIVEYVELPDSTTELIEAGVLRLEDLKNGGFYTVESSDGEWTIVTTNGYSIATGN